MRSVKVWEHYQETFSDEDDKFKWVHTCVSCVAEELKVTEQEARALILQEGATPK